MFLVCFHFITCNFHSAHSTLEECTYLCCFVGGWSYGKWWPNCWMDHVALLVCLGQGNTVLELGRGPGSPHSKSTFPLSVNLLTVTLQAFTGLLKTVEVAKLTLWCASLFTPLTVCFVACSFWLLVLYLLYYCTILLLDLYVLLDRFYDKIVYNLVIINCWFLTNIVLFWFMLVNLLSSMYLHSLYDLFLFSCIFDG